MDPAIRPLEPADQDAIVRLYNDALGREWPVDEGWIVALGTQGVAAITEDRVIGAAVIQPGRSLALLAVDEAFRRRRVGTALHDAAWARLASEAAGNDVGLGAGGHQYLLQGVPAEPADHWAFFARLGWSSDYDSVDLILDLASYSTPSGVHLRAADAGVTFTVGDAADAEEVIAFIDEHHAGWSRAYRAVDPSKLVVGRLGPGRRGRRGDVVASLLWADTGTRWWRLLGPGTGELGCVAVHPDHEGRGIGTSLVARGTEHLQELGLETSWLAWTVRLRFYGFLGYRPWRSFHMSSRRP